MFGNPRASSSIFHDKQLLYLLIIKNQFIAMGQVFVYITRNTVLIHTPNPKSAIIQIVEDHKGSIQEIKECGVDLAPIFELSVQLFTTLIQKQVIQEPLTLKVVSVHAAYRSWLLGLESEKVKIELIKEEQIQNNTTSFKLISPVSTFFNFKIKPNILDLISKVDLSEKNYLEEIPQTFLLVEMKEHVRISKVQGGVKTLLFISHFGQSFNSTIITEALKKRQDAKLLLNTFHNNLLRITEEGRMETVDMLVQDIFGKDACDFIGIPPTVIASCLGKYSKGQKELGNTWDCLKSVLLAFGINICQQINFVKRRTGIEKAIIITHDFHVPIFLHYVQLSFGEVWFHPHGMAADFAHRVTGINS